MFRGAFARFVNCVYCAAVIVVFNPPNHTRVNALGISSRNCPIDTGVLDHSPQNGQWLSQL
jgi:hypothetical protein